MTRGQELRNNLCFQHQARGMYLSRVGNYRVQIEKKDKEIKDLTWKLKFLPEADLEKEIDLYAAPIHRTEAVACGH